MFVGWPAFSVNQVSTIKTPEPTSMKRYKTLILGAKKRKKEEGGVRKERKKRKEKGQKEKKAKGKKREKERKGGWGRKKEKERGTGMCFGG